MTTPRPVARVLTAHRQLEGGGFPVRRPFPTRGLPHLDPFLMLDHMGPVEWAPGEAIGAPDHPHRGFETVTYLLEGEMVHADSAGNHGHLGPGDVQWMTAGDGIIHRALPDPDFKARGGTTHGFQLWVNLPAADKRMKPRYQDIAADRIPMAASEDGRVQVRVIAGACLGVEAVIDTRIPITYLDLRLEPGGALTQPVDPSHTVAVYVYAGSLSVGGRELAEGQVALLGAGDAVALSTSTAGRALLLTGRPIGEPIAQYGPFVMNTEAEIREAIDDFRAGRFATIPATVG